MIVFADLYVSVRESINDQLNYDTVYDTEIENRPQATMLGGMRPVL